MRPEELYARPECPEPGRWLAPDGVATEVDVSDLVASMVRAFKPDVVVETGSYLGDTSEAITRALVLEGRGHLWTVELDSARAEAVRARLDGLQADVATIVCGNSLDILLCAPIDLLFVDTEYGARIQEIRRFRAFASRRCVVVAHDTVVDFYRAALEGLVAEGVIASWAFLPTPRGLAVGRYV